MLRCEQQCYSLKVRQYLQALLPSSLDHLVKLRGFKHFLKHTKTKTDSWRFVSEQKRAACVCYLKKVTAVGTHPALFVVQKPTFLTTYCLNVVMCTHQHGEYVPCVIFRTRPAAWSFNSISTKSCFIRSYFNNIWILFTRWHTNS